MNHAGYYPGATQMTLKVMFAPDGQILGAQAIGQDGVDKRIDVIAAMMQQGADVRDLIDLELCYAPPFSSAKDPVNMAGYMAENILDGLSVSIQYDELDEAIQRGARLIDVRTPGEFMQGHLPGAENLSLDEIRNRLEEFDKSQEIIVYCQVGLRGYYAERILRPHGFNVRNLSGGYKLASAQML
jgi:rhodanese-related sulfurtransferase